METVDGVIRHPFVVRSLSASDDADPSRVDVNDGETGSATGGVTSSVTDGTDGAATPVVKGVSRLWDMVRGKKWGERLEIDWIGGNHHRRRQ